VNQQIQDPSITNRRHSFVTELLKVRLAFPRAFRLVWSASPTLTCLVFLLNIFSSLFPLATLWLTKLTVDLITAESQQTAGITADLRQIWMLLGLLGISWQLNKAISSLVSVLSTFLQQKTQNYILLCIMRKSSELDLAFFESPSNLDMIKNAYRGGLTSAFAFVTALFSFLKNSLILLTVFGALARLHWIAPVVTFATTVPLMISSASFARLRWLMVTSRAQENRMSNYLASLLMLRETAQEIRVFGLQNYLLDRAAFYFRLFLNLQLRISSKEQMATFLLSVISNAGALFVWVYIVVLAVAHRITVGDIFFYTGAVSNLQNSLIALFEGGGQIYEQSLFCESLFQLLDTDPSQVDGALRGIHPGTRCGELRLPKTISKGIEFRNVSFRYPGCENWILRNVSFKLQPNQSAAVVGRNGAGKTTLVKLLMRLYDPTEGAILIDGYDLREYDLDELRSFFTVAFQDYNKYLLTLRENIGFGDVRRIEDMDAIRLAAGKTGLDKLAEKMPDGYETYMGKQFGASTSELSGGQWQTVALARAFMRDSPILIFDEPTATLDAFAEYEIYRAIEEMSTGRIVIFISHRFSNVLIADQIFVFDNGRLVEEGSHAILMNIGGLYASMYTSQANRYVLS